MNSISAIIILVALIAIIFLCLTINSLRKKLAEIPENNSIAEKEAELRVRAYEESTERLLDNTRRQYERQIELLQERLEHQGEELKKMSALEFSQLAEKILDDKTKNLTEKNKNELDHIINPLKENIEEFKKAVRDSYMKENSSREALSAQINTLAKANNEVSRETRKLSDALKGNIAIQGKWGEMVLEKILESAGLIRNIHFISQSSSIEGSAIKDEDNRLQRPDVILLLPGDHKIVVDSKTSLSSYLRALEASDTGIEEKELKQHSLSTRLHIDELARKQYHKNIQGAVEHTLMFIPNDAAYIAALKSEPELGDYALKKNVVIVSPAHILSVVQMISQMWRIENQNKNAEAIAKLGGNLYDKIVAFMSEFENIDKYLKASSKAYDKCLNHLSAGSTSILNRSERLRKMGAKTTKRLPDHLLPLEEYPNEE